METAFVDLRDAIRGESFTRRVGGVRIVVFLFAMAFGWVLYASWQILA